MSQDNIKVIDCGDNTTSIENVNLGGFFIYENNLFAKISHLNEAGLCQALFLGSFLRGELKIDRYLFESEDTKKYLLYGNLVVHNVEFNRCNWEVYIQP